MCISFSLRFSRSLKIDIKKYWEKEDHKDFVVPQPKPHEDQFISSSAITNSWLYHYNYVIMIIIEVLWKTEPPAGLCITTKLPRPPVLTVNVQETCKDHHSLPLLLHFFLKAHDKTKGGGVWELYMPLRWVSYRENRVNLPRLPFSWQH